MRLAIFGSRDVDLPSVRSVVFNEVAGHPLDTTIVSGGAVGVDTEGRRAAEFYRRAFDEKLPDWKKYGRRAGFVRNALIEQDSDTGLCVWNSESRGSIHTRSLFHRSQKLVSTHIVPKAGHGDDLHQEAR